MHPFMQTVTMYIGEAICFIAYIYKKRTNKAEFDQRKMEAEADGKSTKVNYYVFAIAAGFDFFGSTFAYIGLNFISPSIYTMLRGGVVIVTAISSIVFLKRKLKKHQIIGCCAVFTGILTVGLSNFIFGNKENKYSVNQYFLILILIFYIKNNKSLVCKCLQL
jgi:drug/metabolite transporter (DMT)-like permease